MSLRCFEINDKTHFFYVFSHFFREFEKNLNSNIERCLVCIMINSTLLMVSE